MSDMARFEETLATALQLTRRPVAVAFRDAPPPGIARLEGSQPSGCSFWALAATGRVFYTVPSDHYNCPIGSYTHNIPLPAEREHELKDTLALMGEIGYIRMEEVPGVPRLPQTPAVTIYAPLGDASFEPDAVIVTGKPAGLMLLHETATRLGKPPVPLLGRPTCMAIPAALTGAVASSLGCVGNRIYTGLSDDDFYSVIRGDELPALLRELAVVAAANAQLAAYHRDRQVALTR